MSKQKLERKKWQCPSCNRSFEIPANATPAMCPACVSVRHSLSEWGPLIAIRDSVRGHIQRRPLQSMSAVLVVTWLAFFIASPSRKPEKVAVEEPVQKEALKPTASRDELVSPKVAPVPEQPMPPPQPKPLVLSAKDVYSRVVPSVISIETRNEKHLPLSSGTGFMIDGGGTILTNAHVVSASGAVDVLVKTTAGEERVITEVVDIDPDRDLATLKFSGEVKQYLILEMTEPAIGDKAFAIGNPLGLDRSLSEGIVSGIRKLPVSPAKLIQTTAALSPGNSGGPLVDIMGNVIGVNTSGKRDGQNLNFAVSAEDIDRFLKRGGSKRKICDIRELYNLDSPNERVPAKYALPHDVLKGVTGVYIHVSPLQDATTSAGVSAASLEAQVKQLLISNGIVVLTDPNEVNHRRLPFLSIRVATIANATRSAYGYVVNVDMDEAIPASTLGPDVNALFVTVWSSDLHYGSCGKTEVPIAIRKSLSDCMRKFVDDWKKGNSKK